MHRPRSIGRFLTVAAALALIGASPARAQISFQGSAGSTCVSIATGAQTHTVTFNFGVPANPGQTAILVGAVSAYLMRNGVTDNSAGGNAWAADSVASPVANTAFLYSARITNTIATGGAGTVTMAYNNTSGSTQTSCMSVLIFNGLSTLPGFLDGTGSNSATGTAVSISTIAPTTQANDVLVAAIALTSDNGNSFTSGSGQQGQAMNAGAYGVRAPFKIVAATGVQTLTGTFMSSTPWVGALAVYKGANCTPDSMSPIVIPPASAKITQTLCM